MTYDDIWVWCTRPTKSGNVKLSSSVLPHPIAFRSTLAKHGKTVCCLCVFPGCRRHVLNRFPVLFSENPGKALQNFLYCRSSHMYFLPFSLLFPEHFLKKRGFPENMYHVKNISIKFPIFCHRSFPPHLAPLAAWQQFQGALQQLLRLPVEGRSLEMLRFWWHVKAEFTGSLIDSEEILSWFLVDP